MPQNWPRCKCGHIAQDHNRKYDNNHATVLGVLYRKQFYGCDRCDTCHSYRFPEDFPQGERDALLKRTHKFDLGCSVNKTYIDDTDVELDNRDICTTELYYKDLPNDIFVVDVRFALQIVADAIQNNATDAEYHSAIVALNYVKVVIDKIRKDV